MIAVWKCFCRLFLLVHKPYTDDISYHFLSCSALFCHYCCCWIGVCVSFKLHYCLPSNYLSSSVRYVPVGKSTNKCFARSKFTHVKLERIRQQISLPNAQQQQGNTAPHQIQRRKSTREQHNSQHKRIPQDENFTRHIEWTERTSEWTNEQTNEMRKVNKSQTFYKTNGCVHVCAERIFCI